MDPAALTPLVTWIGTLDAPALFILVLVLGYKQVWVWGHQLVDLRADRDFWRATALGTTHIAVEKTK